MTAETAVRCSLCYRDATVRVEGKYSNGRAATDFRCDNDKPDPTNVGTWVYMGTSDKSFLVATIEPVA